MGSNGASRSPSHGNQDVVFRLPISGNGHGRINITRTAGRPPTGNSGHGGYDAGTTGLFVNKVRDSLYQTLHIYGLGQDPLGSRHLSSPQTGLGRQ